MLRVRVAMLLVLLLSGGGCSVERTGLATSDGVADDLGARDLGSVDLRTVDVGAVDLGGEPVDLGPTDLGPPDLGPPDLGPPDLGGLPICPSCPSGQVCVGDTCVSCGGYNEFCCAGGTCGWGTSCQSDGRCRVFR